MIIFIGEELKGSWLPEISSAINETSCIVHENYHIEQQINEILAISDCTYIIFDVSQYIVLRRQLHYIYYVYARLIMQHL